MLGSEMMSLCMNACGAAGQGVSNDTMLTSLPQSVPKQAGIHSC